MLHTWSCSNNSLTIVVDVKVKFVFTYSLWLGSAQSAHFRMDPLLAKVFYFFSRLPAFVSETTVTNFLQVSLQRKLDGTASLPSVFIFTTITFNMDHDMRHFNIFPLFLDYCPFPKFRPKNKKQYLVFLKTVRKPFYAFV